MTTKPRRFRAFYQSHASGGYSAAIKIEWSVPKGVDIDDMGGRGDKAEELAENALGYAGPITRDIVAAMLGRTK